MNQGQAAPLAQQAVPLAQPAVAAAPLVLPAPPAPLPVPPALPAFALGCRILGLTALNSLLQYVNWLVWEDCSVN